MHDGGDGRGGAAELELISVSLATSADFAAILALQKLNHLNFLPENARGDGFLTTFLETPKLENLIAQNGLFIAKSGEELAGYVCSEAWDLSGERQFHLDVATLFPLFLRGREIGAGNSRIYGPVCVAAEFRGQGVLAALVEAVRAGYRADFEFILTFIDTKNARSLAAHERKLGFQIVSHLPYDDTKYHVLALAL